MELKQNNLGAVVLAAGKGTRMKSDIAKVLHKVNGQTMLSCVLDAASDLVGKRIVVVVGHQSESVKKEVLKTFEVGFAHQKALLGTGDAVKCALPGLSPDVGDVLILCGDVPLIRTKTLSDLAWYHKKNQFDITVVAVNMENPEGYGRIIQDTDNLLAGIKEDADACSAEKKITLVNAGIYCVKKDFLEKGLALIKTDNAQKEYYFTDIVAIAKQLGKRAVCFIVQDPAEVFGVNTVEELKRAEQLLIKMDL
ncbi:MAG: NTP transferase domain-containing protein [Thermodesulfobacteriota bacterium]|nr:NTP transferase domain-containing protein [Thermodesulfobacteriota bacterium]